MDKSKLIKGLKQILSILNVAKFFIPGIVDNLVIDFLKNLIDNVVSGKALTMGATNSEMSAFDFEVIKRAFLRLMPFIQQIVKSTENEYDDLAVEVLLMILNKPAEVGVVVQ